MAHTSFTSQAEWYDNGREATFVRDKRSSGGLLHMVEVARPSGEYPQPAVPDLVLYQEMSTGLRVRGNAGWGRFDTVSKKGCLYLSAPHYADEISLDSHSECRVLSLPLSQWQDVLTQSSDSGLLMEHLRVPEQAFQSRTIQQALRTLWALTEEEGPPSRLLARAAGCEILAELCKLSGVPFAEARGGLAPWAERRSKQIMRERLAEDISLDQLAAEVQLSPFHFARMFKQSVGVTPRVYLTQLRMEKACELLERTDRPITEIAFDVGYSSNQVLARVFSKYERMTPSEFRRATRY